jgi:hypothetical protein
MCRYAKKSRNAMIMNILEMVVYTISMFVLLQKMFWFDDVFSAPIETFLYNRSPPS